MRYELCASQDLPQGKSRAMEAGGKKLVVYHLSDGFYATQARCPHVFASLGKGKILKDKCVQCPLHRAEFDIRTGEVVKWANFPPGVQMLNVVRGEKPLDTWPVSEENGQLYVEI